ncbi:MAG: putative selenium-dependent hydroxylase accessory protein YqeC [Oscillospiraceae bacterium]|nr:putative selenium-dependent hydroxylase accessory protein YqeC [Oscillospiraceae bacterium]
MNAPWLEELCHSLPACTAIIGGGGKTTLMFTLARTLAAEGYAVLTTTTTHLAWPPPKSVRFCTPETAETLNGCACPGTVILAGQPCEGQRMRGVDFPLEGLNAFDFVLCEADGSNRLPLKVHRETEPVIPPAARLVIQVAGLSALGRPVGETVHRYGLMGLFPEEPVTPTLVERILLRGWQRWPRGGLTLLNQADTPELGRAGREIGERLYEQGFPTLVGVVGN